MILFWIWFVLFVPSLGIMANTVRRRVYDATWQDYITALWISFLFSVVAWVAIVIFMFMGWLVWG